MPCRRGCGILAEHPQLIPSTWQPHESWLPISSTVSRVPSPWPLVPLISPSCIGPSCPGAGAASGVVLRHHPKFPIRACTVPWQRLYFFSCFPVFFAIGLFHRATAITRVVWGGLSVPLSKQLAAWCADPGPCGGLRCCGNPTSQMAPTFPGHGTGGKNI